MKICKFPDCERIGSGLQNLPEMFPMTCTGTLRLVLIRLGLIGLCRGIAEALTFPEIIGLDMEDIK